MGTTVAEILNDAQSESTDHLTQADRVLNRIADLTQLILNVEDPFVTIHGSTDWSRSALDSLRGGKPRSPGSATINAVEPVAPTLRDTSDVDDISVPALRGSAPTIDIPAAPSASLPERPTQPVISDPVLPAEPAGLEVQIRELIDELGDVDVGVRFPDAPTLEVPTFAGTAPIDELVAPTRQFAFAETEYTSALKDVTVAKLITDIEAGGYVNDSEERQLWARQRDRQAQVNRSRVDEVERSLGTRGFSRPTGALATALDAAHQQGLAESSEANRNETLSRAQLYIQHRQFTFGQATQVEQLLIGFHSSVQERALNAERAVVGLGIEVFNAQVARFNVRLQSYQTEAQVFGERVRAVLAEAQIFNTQIQAASTEVEAQTQLITALQAQIGGVRDLVDLHRTRLDAVRIETDIERQRLEAFRAAMSGYEASVRAKTAEFGMYESRIRGQEARINVFNADVQAHRSRVQAAAVESEIQLGNLRARREANAQDLQKYDAQLRGYRESLGRQLEIARLALSTYQAETGAYSAEAAAVGRAFQVAIASDRNQLDVDEAKLRRAIAVADHQVREFESTTNLRMTASIAYADAVKGLLDAINAVSGLVVQSTETEE